MNTNSSVAKYLIATSLAVTLLGWSSVRSNASDDHGGSYLQQLSRPAPTVQTTRTTSATASSNAHGGNYLQQLAGVTRDAGPQTPSLAPPYSYGSLHGGGYLLELGWGQQPQLAPVR